MIGLNMEEIMNNQTFSKLNTTTFKTDLPEKDLSVIVGDEKQVDFKPRLKIEKWDNEVNFSVGVIDDGTQSSQKLENGKITWTQGKKSAHFYNLENGFEFDLMLSEKPQTNIVNFSIQTKGLDFFYQPFLTEEELLAKEIDRPENVEGSYAVYHKSKKNNEYQTGKVFHIYRPKIFDADGKWAWGKMNIDVAKEILSIEIPQSILDKGKYPLIVDPTFGYGTAGGSSATIPTLGMKGSVFTGVAGTGNSISAYLACDSTHKFKFNIYIDSTLGQLTNGQTNEGTSNSATAQWWTLNFASSPTLTAVNYDLAAFSDTIKGSDCYFYFDTGSTNQGFNNTTGSYPTWPDPLVKTTQNTNQYSIYCTYTASGGIPATNYLGFF